VEFYFNKKRIHSIECETQGLFDNYWPIAAPAGTKSVVTGWTRIESLILNGTAEFRVKANPHAVLDIHRVELRVRHPSSQQERLLNEDKESAKREMVSILFLAADPTDISRLRLGEELREIQEKLQVYPKRIINGILSYGKDKVRDH